MQVFQWFEKRSQAFIFVIALFSIMLIGLIDWLTGTEVSVGAFYLLPITIAAWCGGKRLGWLMALLAVCAWFLAEATFRPDGHLQATVYWNTLIRLAYFLPVLYLAVSLRERLVREEQSARLDALTCSHNLRSFREIVDLELARCRRSYEPLTLVYLDLDNFKEVNDKWGHERGDGLLRQIAAVIRTNLRPMDTLGRLGGDEFAILMPMTDSEQSCAVTVRLRDTLLATMKEEAMPVTFSIGAASFTTAPESLADAVRKADALMYQVKKKGKNAIEYATFGDVAGRT